MTHKCYFLHHCLGKAYLGLFYSLLPIAGMLLAVALQPYAQDAALVVFWIFFLETALLGGWLTGQWITTELDPEKFHPGYFLPTVAGGSFFDML
ncbi:MAG TPA: hypothetical protein VF026_27245 [Ktedonobacteraceae bacterium]